MSIDTNETIKTMATKTARVAHHDEFHIRRGVRVEGSAVVLFDNNPTPERETHLSEVEAIFEAEGLDYALAVYPATGDDVGYTQAIVAQCRDAEAAERVADAVEAYLRSEGMHVNAHIA